MVHSFFLRSAVGHLARQIIPYVPSPEIPRPARPPDQARDQRWFTPPEVGDNRASSSK